MILTNKKNNFFSDLEKAILNDLRKPAAKNKKKRNRQKRTKVNITKEIPHNQRKQGQASYLSERLAKLHKAPRYDEKQLAASIKAIKFTSIRKFKKFLYYRIHKIRRWYSKLPKYSKKFARVISKIYNITHDSSVIKHFGKKSKTSKFTARYLSIVGRLYKKARGWKVRRIKSFIRPSFRFRYFYRYKPRIYVTDRRRKYFKDMFSSPVFELVSVFGRYNPSIESNDTIATNYKDHNSTTFSNVVEGSKLRAHFPFYSKSSKIINSLQMTASSCSVERRRSINFTYKRVPSKFFRFFYLKRASMPLIFDKSFFFSRSKKVGLSSLKRYYSAVSWYNVRRRCAYFFRKYKLSTRFSLRNSYKHLFSRVFSRKKRFSFAAFFGVFDKLGSVRYRFRGRRARYMRSHRFKLRKHNLYSGAITKNFRRLLRKTRKLLYGIHFYKSVNNIFVNVSTQRGKSLYSYSAGRTPFKGSKRLSPAAAELMGKHVSYVLKSNKIGSVALVFHSPLNYLFRAVLRGLASNLKFSALKYHLSRPHNGLRLRLSRRV